MEATPAAVSQGRKLYASSDCAICHGKEGDGKGVLARDINMNTRNWHDPNSLAALTDGALFFTLARGKGRMPGYEKRETPDQIWQMVDYIRSLGGK
ncbi:MAG: cytochrome c [Candidatus Acidiferrales bacterium]